MNAILEFIKQPDSVTLRLGGRLDIRAADKCRKACVEAAQFVQPVFVDWDAVEQIDLSALQLLLALGKARQGVEFSFGSDSVRTFLAWSGLTNEFRRDTKGRIGSRR